MTMSEPFPIINLAALGQVDDLEGYPTITTHHHQHAATVSTPTAVSLTSPTGAAAALHHHHHHHHFNHRRCPSSSAATVSATTAKTGAFALINRGWNRLGSAATRSSSNASTRGYDGTSHHFYNQHDVSSTMPYSAEEAFQIKLGLMMKNPAILARFQERLRADSPFHGHDTIIRMELQDFFEQELWLVDIGPEIRQSKLPTAGDEVETAAAKASSSRPSSLFRSALGALVNKADETTTAMAAAATTSDGISSSAGVQPLQTSSSPTATACLNMSPFQNEGGIPEANSSIAQDVVTATVDTTPGPTSSGLNSSDNNNEIQRPTYLNLPSLEFQNDSTTSSTMTACSSPILENSVYEREFSMSSSSSSEEDTPDAVESICASSSSSISAGSSHDDDSVGLPATTTTTTCTDPTHKTKQVATTAAESPSSGVYFEL
jgi:hypothetical protein